MEVDGDAGDLAVALAVGAVDRGRDEDDFLKPEGEGGAVDPGGGGCIPGRIACLDRNAQEIAYDQADPLRVVAATGCDSNVVPALAGVAAY
jgi:hypothetical protein